MLTYVDKRVSFKTAMPDSTNPSSLPDVSEQFLNGTSAQCRLFSAIPLKVEKRYEIQSKWMKENKWATIHEKSLYATVQMNISQKRKDSIKIDSIK